MIKLHDLHTNPELLDHHNDVDLVPQLAWYKFTNIQNYDLKKKEKYGQETHLSP